jgi:hypothetical protein
MAGRPKHRLGPKQTWFGPKRTWFDSNRYITWKEQKEQRVHRVYVYITCCIIFVHVNNMCTIYQATEIAGISEVQRIMIMKKKIDI